MGVGGRLEGGGMGLRVAFEQGVDQAQRHGLPAARILVELRDPREQGVRSGVEYGGRGHAGMVAKLVNCLSSMSTDYADLFCGLFDRLDPVEFRAEGPAWMADAGVAETAAAVEQLVLEGGPVAATEGGRQTFAALLGLDAALARANPVFGAAAPPALAEYALRYAEAGRLDSGAVLGALLPRFARPGRRGQLPEDQADAFGAVVRVSQGDWSACDHATLPATCRLTRPDREGNLRVATAPMIREPDELEWNVEERAGVRFYRIHPAGRETTRAR